MKLTIKRTDKNVALLKKLISRDRNEAYQARLSLAQFIGEELLKVINTVPTISNLFTRLPFNENDNPSIPLDLYRDVDEEGFLSVWSQVEAGGMPTNMPTPPTQELKFTTYTLDSAWAFHKKYARDSRLDVVAKTFERILQEIILKQERNSAALLLRALASAVSPVKNATVQAKHILRTNTANQLVLDDFVRLFTLAKRIRPSWNQGTPNIDQGRGITDMLVSIETIEEFRRMAYNPMNTRGGVVGGTAYGVGIPLPEATREQIFANAGIPEFYGVAIHQLNELGVGYKYNDLFDYYASTTTYPDHTYDFTETSHVTAFDGAAEEIMIGLDLSVGDALVRPVLLDGETGSEFTVMPDDQFTDRAGKIGWYGSLNEGRLVLDDRILTGLIR